MTKFELLRLIETAETPKEITLALLSAMVMAPEKTESILNTIACAYIKEKSKKMEVKEYEEEMYCFYI